MKILNELAQQWNQSLSSVSRLPVEAGYPARDTHNPPFCDAPASLKDKPWNKTPLDLWENAKDCMVYERQIAGQKIDDLVITKTDYIENVTSGFSGIPDNGLKGPGIMGVGSYEGHPSPVSVAADIIILDQDSKTGLIYAYLGQRPEYCFAGGFADTGEMPIDTAIREFFEEVLVSSYPLGEKADAFLAGRNWTDLDPSEKETLCTIVGVSSEHAKQPFIAEFKYQLLKTRDPDAVKAINGCFKHRTVESYAGLVTADPRICDRAVFTNAFSMVVGDDDLEAKLASFGLTAQAQSEEIGKLNRVLIDPNLLIKNQETGSTGMYASHGPILLMALAHQIQRGDIDFNLGQAASQINCIIEAVQADIANHPHNVTALERTGVDRKKGGAKPPRP